MSHHHPSTKTFPPSHLQNPSQSTLIHPPSSHSNQLHLNHPTNLSTNHSLNHHHHHPHHHHPHHQNQSLSHHQPQPQHQHYSSSIRHHHNHHHNQSPILNSSSSNQDLFHLSQLNQNLSSDLISSRHAGTIARSRANSHSIKTSTTKSSSSSSSSSSNSPSNQFINLLHPPSNQLNIIPSTIESIISSNDNESNPGRHRSYSSSTIHPININNLNKKSTLTTKQKTVSLNPENSSSNSFSNLSSPSTLIKDPDSLSSLSNIHLLKPISNTSSTSTNSLLQTSNLLSPINSNNQQMGYFDLDRTSSLSIPHPTQDLLPYSISSSNPLVLPQKPISPHPTPILPSDQLGSTSNHSILSNVHDMDQNYHAFRSAIVQTAQTQFIFDLKDKLSKTIENVILSLGQSSHTASISSNELTSPSLINNSNKSTCYPTPISQIHPEFNLGDSVGNSRLERKRSRERLDSDGNSPLSKAARSDEPINPSAAVLSRPTPPASLGSLSTLNSNEITGLGITGLVSPSSSDRSQPRPSTFHQPHNSSLSTTSHQTSFNGPGTFYNQSTTHPPSIINTLNHINQSTHPSSQLSPSDLSIPQSRPTTGSNFPTPLMTPLDLSLSSTTNDKSTLITNLTHDINSTVTSATQDSISLPSTSNITSPLAMDHSASSNAQSLTESNFNKSKPNNIHTQISTIISDLSRQQTDLSSIDLSPSLTLDLSLSLSSSNPSLPSIVNSGDRNVPSRPQLANLTLSDNLHSNHAFSPSSQSLIGVSSTSISTPLELADKPTFLAPLSSEIIDETMKDDFGHDKRHSQALYQTHTQANSVNCQKQVNRSRRGTLDLTQTPIHSLPSLDGDELMNMQNEGPNTQSNSQGLITKSLITQQPSISPPTHSSSNIITPRQAAQPITQSNQQPPRVPSPPVNKQMGAASAGVSEKLAAQFEPIFTNWLGRLCSDLDMKDSKGEPIHQTLMARKMQRLEESADFRPFKFRIQAFTNSFFEELVRHGFSEKDLPMKKVRQYLWSQSCISRFNEEGKKAKSKGNHVWHIEAQKIMNGQWNFLHFQRKIIGNPPSEAYVGVKWTWAAKVWDPQCSAQNIKAVFSSPELPSWLHWKDNVLSGLPSPSDVGQLYDLMAVATTNYNSSRYTLELNFHITVRPAEDLDTTIKDETDEGAPTALLSDTSIGSSEQPSTDTTPKNSPNPAGLTGSSGCMTNSEQTLKAILDQDAKNYLASCVFPGLARTESSDTIPSIEDISSQSQSDPALVEPDLINELARVIKEGDVGFDHNSGSQVEMDFKASASVGDALEKFAAAQASASNNLQSINLPTHSIGIDLGPQINFGSTGQINLMAPGEGDLTNRPPPELELMVHQQSPTVISSVEGLLSTTMMESESASAMCSGATCMGGDDIMDQMLGSNDLISPSNIFDSTRSMNLTSVLGDSSSHLMTSSNHCSNSTEAILEEVAQIQAAAVAAQQGAVTFHEASLQTVRDNLMSSNDEVSDSTGNMIRQAIESNDPVDRQFAAAVLGPMTTSGVVASVASSINHIIPTRED
ncbi:hypothetical protein O181_033864 [Austropuccinia psidii MF-1]|uniref:Uncharacterized protein n=1 Tax=Austropuccinia psidii MF-1 TaxID=1389203 RepID=A0A9Q3CZW2_9BASI|nr:hypothetical protein [Austropuccinia psidii MF-1]